MSNDYKLCYKDDQCNSDEACIQNICTEQLDDRYTQMDLRIDTGKMSEAQANRIHRSKKLQEKEIHEQGKLFIPKSGSHCTICGNYVKSYEPRIICRKLHVNHMNCIRKWETNNPNHSKLSRTDIKSLPERNGQCIDCNPNPNPMKPGQTEWTPEQIDEREKTKYFKFTNDQEKEEFIRLITEYNSKGQKDTKNNAYKLYGRIPGPKRTVENAGIFGYFLGQPKKADTNEKKVVDDIDVFDEIRKELPSIRRYFDGKIMNHYMYEGIRERREKVNAVIEVSLHEDLENGKQLLNNFYDIYKKHSSEIKYTFIFIPSDMRGEDRYIVTFYRQWKGRSIPTTEDTHDKGVVVSTEEDTNIKSVEPNPQKETRKNMAITTNGEVITIPITNINNHIAFCDVSTYKQLIFNNNFMKMFVNKP